MFQKSFSQSIDSVDKREGRQPAIRSVIQIPRCTEFVWLEKLCTEFYNKLDALRAFTAYLVLQTLQFVAELESVIKRGH